MKLQSQDKKQICGFGIAVFDYEDYKLDITIESLKKINYDKDKYKIILSTKNNQKTYEVFNHINNFKNNSILAESIITLDTDVNIEKEAFIKCLGATHLVKINSGDVIDPNTLIDINDIVIEHQRDYVAFEKDNIKIIDFNTANGMYLDYNSFDKLFESLKKTTKYKNLNEK